MTEEQLDRALYVFHDVHADAPRKSTRDALRAAIETAGEPTVGWLADGIVHAIKRDDPETRAAFEVVAEHALCEAHYADMLARVEYFSRFP